MSAAILSFAPRRPEPEHRAWPATPPAFDAVCPAAPVRRRLSTKLLTLLERLDAEQQQIVELVILPEGVRLPASAENDPGLRRLLHRLELSSDEAAVVANCVAEAFVRGVPGRAVRNG